jgi:hypothetical protein
LKSISITTRPRSNSNASALLDGISVALFLTGPRLAPLDLIPIPPAAAIRMVGHQHQFPFCVRTPRRPLECTGRLFLPELLLRFPSTLASGCPGWDSSSGHFWGVRPCTTLRQKRVARPTSSRQTMAHGEGISGGSFRTGDSPEMWDEPPLGFAISTPKGSTTAGKLRSRIPGRRSGRRRR